MARLLLLTEALEASAEVLPALGLLGHRVRILPARGSALLDADDADVLLVDGRRDLAGARDLCHLAQTTGIGIPVLGLEEIDPSAQVRLCGTVNP